MACIQKPDPSDAEQAEEERGVSNTGYNAVLESDYKTRVRVADVKGQVHSTSVKVHTDSFADSPELYV